MDRDSGLNGELIYRIEAGAQDRFLIHPVTGVIRVANATIDREEQESYRLVVVATDRGTVPLSGTALITILIDDINDSRPEFLNPIQTVSVLESAEPGTVIANVTAIDRDLNPKLEYHIIGIVAKDDTDRLVPDQEDAFAVNINTGTRAGSPPTPLLPPCPSLLALCFLPDPSFCSSPSLGCSSSCSLPPHPASQCSLSCPSLPWLLPSLLLLLLVSARSLLQTASLCPCSTRTPTSSTPARTKYCKAFLSVIV